jgi:hypothetical protein
MFDVLFFETTPDLFFFGLINETLEPNDALPPPDDFVDFAAGLPAIFVLPD